MVHHPIVRTSKRPLTVVAPMSVTATEGGRRRFCERSNGVGIVFCQSGIVTIEYHIELSTYEYTKAPRGTVPRRSTWQQTHSLRRSVVWFSYLSSTTSAFRRSSSVIPRRVTRTAQPLLWNSERRRKTILQRMC